MKMRYTAKLSKIFLLSLIIYPFSEICIFRCIDLLGLLIFSVFKDDNGGNIIVHIVIGKKGEIMFPLLTVLSFDGKQGICL